MEHDAGRARGPEGTPPSRSRHAARRGALWAPRPPSFVFHGRRRSHKDAAILDTLARVFHEQGQPDTAIEWQRKASEYNLGEPSVDATLKKYEAEKASQSPDSGPPRESAAGAAKKPQ